MSDTQIINHVRAFLTSQFGEFCSVTADDAVNTIAVVDSAAADELDRLRAALVEIKRLNEMGGFNGCAIAEVYSKHLPP